jgi:16S rRNA G966 N2-methylase RsmD
MTWCKNIIIVLVLLIIFAIVIVLRYKYCTSIGVKKGGGEKFPIAQFTKTQLDEMMKKLKEYDGMSRILNEPYTFLKNKKMSILFRGKPTIILNKKSDYYDFNRLSHMFNDEQRMKCRVRNEDTPWEYFHKTSSLKDLSDKDTIEMIWKNAKECTSHKPNILVTLVQLFGSTSIIDPTSGWGDRLAGAIASNVSYVGIDNNDKLFKGYNDMIKTFNYDKATMLCGDTLKVDIPKQKYDLIFTSPPYSNYEKYAKANTGLSDDKWYKTFLKPMLERYWDILEPFGFMCINISHTHEKQTYLNNMLDMKLKDGIYQGVISYTKMDKKNPQPIWIWLKTPAYTDKVYLRKLETLDFTDIYKIFKNSKYYESKNLTSDDIKKKIKESVKSNHPVFVICNYKHTLIGFDLNILIQMNNSNRIHFIMDSQYKNLKKDAIKASKFVTSTNGERGGSHT